jgi:hypothetical protein
MGDIFGNIFGVFFQVQMIWYKMLLKARDAHEKKLKFHLFWNAIRRLKVWKIVFFVFSSRKQGNKYVQNNLLAP